MLLALCLGALCGLRTFTPISAVAFAAHRHWLVLTGTPFAFLSSTAALVISVMLALGELIVDKLPKTPSRLRPAGLIGRTSLGAVSAVAFAFAHHCSTTTALVAAGAGIAGALLGAFFGHRARTGLVRVLNSPDLPVAGLEDALCIAGSFLIVLFH